MAPFSQRVRRVFLYCCTGFVLMTVGSAARKESLLSQEMTVQNEMRHNGIISTLKLDPIVETTDPAPSFQAIFSVKNITSSPVPFTFSSSQRYDFQIQDDSGQELWKWSDGRFFAMLIVETDLGQEPWVFRERIPAVNREGRPLPAGQYTLRARLMSNPPIDNQLSFQIQ